MTLMLIQLAAVLLCQPLPTPVDVTVYAHTFKVHHHYIQWQLPPSVAQPQDLPSLIPTLLPAWEQQLLQGLTLQVPMPELLSHLQSPILVASDGSVNEHWSFFGWALANQDGLRLLSSRGPAPWCQPNQPPIVLRELGYYLSSDVSTICSSCTTSLSLEPCCVTMKA